MLPICQRVDLETTRIRQDGLIPVHELVKPSSPSNQLIPWPQPEVVGVGEDDARTHFFELFWGHGFDRCLGPYWHKHGGWKGAMRGDDFSQAGTGVLLFFD